MGSSNINWVQKYSLKTKKERKRPKNIKWWYEKEKPSASTLKSAVTNNSLEVKTKENTLLARHNIKAGYVENREIHKIQYIKKKEVHVIQMMLLTWNK